MGNGSSKEEQHVFEADAPVRFSQSVVDSLQGSSDSDSTRAQDYEFKIQARVNSELKRLRDEQSKKLDDLTTSLGADSTPSSSSASSPSRQQHQQQTSSKDDKSLLTRLSPFSSNSDSSSDSQSSLKPSDLSHDSVQKEITDLRQKLDSRKKLEKASPEVEKAKQELTKCLRKNDRRPLDCWEEVESFKREVGKLEQGFLRGAVG